MTPRKQFQKRHGFSRRSLFHGAAAVTFSGSMSGWLRALAEQSAPRFSARHCILLWMTGGPSQIDTFDLKPGNKNGGEFKPISTSVPGVKICEHLPQLAKCMEDLTIVRSMSTKEGDHSRATYLLRTGRLPQGPIRFPTFGSVVSKELGNSMADLPNFVSVNPQSVLSPAAYGSGFLGPKYSPLVVGGGGRGGGENESRLNVRNLELPDEVNRDQLHSRLKLLALQNDDFEQTSANAFAHSHRIAYERAVRMMHPEIQKTFDLTNEPDELRDAYGRSDFGQGCLLARRLVEQGVRFVEVSLNGVPDAQVFGWDTHFQNFENVKKLCQVLDPAWATLMQDLKRRGLLDSTLVVWMGEFGRTPRINVVSGRDHFPNAWSVVLGGAGIQGGGVYGRTSDDGMTVEDNPVSVPDLLSTICSSMGMDSAKENQSNIGRPIRLVEPDGSPISGVLA